MTDLCNDFPPYVEFSAYKCVKAIKRDPNSGKNIIWLREALTRLANTTYRGSIFMGDSKKSFTLMRYEYIEDAKGKKIKITFDEHLIKLARYYKNLLTIDEEVIREESGIKKRLLELVKVCKGNALEWTTKLSRLNEICAHEGQLKEFKRLLKSYALPWKISFSKSFDREDNVTFT
jgi:hypothetical protein